MDKYLFKAVISIPALFFGVGLAARAWGSSFTLQSVSGSGSATAAAGGGAGPTTSTFALPGSSYTSASSQFLVGAGILTTVGADSGIWFSNQPQMAAIPYGASFPDPPSTPPLGVAFNSISFLLSGHSPYLYVNDNGTASVQESVAFSFVLDSAAQCNFFLESGLFYCTSRTSSYTWSITGPNLNLNYTNPNLFPGFSDPPISLLAGTYNVTGTASASYTPLSYMDNFQNTISEEQFSLQIIPEPGTIGLLGIGGVGLLLRIRQDNGLRKSMK